MSQQVKIEYATKEDHEVLTTISFAAKRYWNYPEEYIQIWKDGLTITPQYIDDHFVIKAVKKGKIVGFTAFEKEGYKKRGELAHLWIEPDAMRQGIGTMLIEELKSHIKKLGLRTFITIADPNARGFYEKHGGVFIEEYPSTPKGRMLPILEFPLVKIPRKVEYKTIFVDIQNSIQKTTWKIELNGDHLSRELELTLNDHSKLGYRLLSMEKVTYSGQSLIKGFLLVFEREI